MARRRRRPARAALAAQDDRILVRMARLITVRARLTVPGANVPDPDPKLPAPEQLKRAVATAEKTHGADNVAGWLEHFKRMIGGS